MLPMSRSLDIKSHTTDKIEAIKQLIADSSTRDKNEAETRHKIIDYVIHDYLAWPKNRVSVEEYIHPGFADYILKKSNGEDLLFIEAKREGVFFELPIAHSKLETSCFIPLKQLLTDENIRVATKQVRDYCYDSGCEYACITNGHEWIFFRTFEKGKKWESLQAFVVRSLDFFYREYTKAINNFSYVAITENSSLLMLLTSAPPKDRSIYFPKEKIPSYSHAITSNKLANSLRPIAIRYFGIINDDDTEFMEKCYVSQREYQGTLEGMRTIIHDSLSPYFAEFGVQQLEDTGKGGRLGGKLTKILKNRKRGEVLVLFGGKGAGKSTFIKRLLHHNVPRWLRDHAVVPIVDLLPTPESEDVIRKTIWDTLVSQLDADRLLSSERDTLLVNLFQDRYEVARKQDLSGLQISSESYNVKLNQLIHEWKADKIYCAKRLAEYWEKKGKGVIVVLDNTDQYKSAVQDFCFSSAQEISKQLNCIALISMREERFYDSKIHGVLDAYQNSGFHISSPRPAEVFKKRLDYTVALLKDDQRRDSFLGDLDRQFAQDCITYLSILSREFSNDSSPLNCFLTACAHGDIRLSLDLFRSFLLSGYTNVEEMITSGSWTFKIHQVIKPVMIPKRYFYDEGVSDIPNIYQLRSPRHGSHFTGLRILRKLSKTVDITSPSYFAVAELKGYFAEVFNMLDDFERNLDVLLKHGFVEANNRLDSYSDAVDSIKITNYGLYMLAELSCYFTYLDLICTDCGIFDERTSNYLTEAAKREYNLFTRGERVERVKVRLERVQKFIEYLASEEASERVSFSLGMPENEMFTFKARQSFTGESRRVLASASRQGADRTHGRAGGRRS